MSIWERAGDSGVWRLFRADANSIDQLKSLITLCYNVSYDAISFVQTGKEYTFSFTDFRESDSGIKYDYTYRFMIGDSVVDPIPSDAAEPGHAKKATHYPDRMRRSVLQDWVMEQTFMQQSVLIAAMRGPDGVEKNHLSKKLAKWYRRCVVISAFDRRALDNPYHPGGGSYTGPSMEVDSMTLQVFQDTGKGLDAINWEAAMDGVVKDYLKSIDSLPHHYHLHFLHAIEILGYKHSDLRIRKWWHKTYLRMVHDMHLAPETEQQLDNRLDDNESKWRADETRFKK